jgi:hypothetical protein
VSGAYPAEPEFGSGRDDLPFLAFGFFSFLSWAAVGVDDADGGGLAAALTGGISEKDIGVLVAFFFFLDLVAAVFAEPLKESASEPFFNVEPGAVAEVAAAAFFFGFFLGGGAALSEVERLVGGTFPTFVEFVVDNAALVLVDGLLLEK